MANERTLTERFLNPEIKSPRTARQRKELVTNSIIRHLRNLLNSRQGCCEILDDYGMPEMESKSDAKNLLSRELETSIRNTISRYEPRLKNVQVRMDVSEEDRLTPRFIIKAVLTSRDSFSKDISFSTIVDPMGTIRIK